MLRILKETAKGYFKKQNSDDTDIHQIEKVHEVGNLTFLNRQKKKFVRKVWIKSNCNTYQVQVLLEAYTGKIFYLKKNSIKN